MRAIALALALALTAACAPSAAVEAPAPRPAPASVLVEAGAFRHGSDPDEREYAYGLDEAAYGHSRTREWGWYDRERPGRAEIGAFRIMTTPVTNALYHDFVEATGWPAPEVDEATWRSYRLIHPYDRTRRHAWIDGAPPEGRDDHPVVMVSHADAMAFAQWLSAETGQDWRLPTAREWEKAARGVEGRYFPWGDAFDPSFLNSHDQGPFDTQPVGLYPRGASPFGMMDAAGQVFEWTTTPAGEGRFLVKGGSWDDRGCGVCRPAAAHGRPEAIKHILVGFRLVRDADR